jgi:hypothetical protein
LLTGIKQPFHQRLCCDRISEPTDLLGIGDGL